MQNVLKAVHLVVHIEVKGHLSANLDKCCTQHSFINNIVPRVVKKMVYLLKVFKFKTSTEAISSI